MGIPYFWPKGGYSLFLDYSRLLFFFPFFSCLQKIYRRSLFYNNYYCSIVSFHFFSLLLLDIAPFFSSPLSPRSPVSV